MKKFNPNNILRINTTIENAENTIQEYMKFIQGKITYDAFILSYLRINHNDPMFVLGYTLEWLEENRNNNDKHMLSSSGSLFSALIDFDNRFTPWGEELLSEEEFEYAEQLQEKSLSVYHTWAVNESLL